MITLSDKGARGEREDKSGPAIVERLKQNGYEVVEQILIADEQSLLKTHLIRLADQRQLDLILTTGGTGFSPRDTQPGGDAGGGNAPGSRHCGGDSRRVDADHEARDALPRSVGHSRQRPLVLQSLPAAPRPAWKAWTSS